MKLADEQIAKLHECMGALSDDFLSDTQGKWLNDRLEASEQAREIYVRTNRLCANLNWDYGVVPGDTDFPADKLILGEPIRPELLKTALTKPSDKQEEQVRRGLSLRNIHASYWMIVPLLVIGVYWGGFHLIQNSFSVKEQIADVDLLQIGKRRELSQGILELSFPTGSQVVLTAPTTFIVTGNNSIRLLEGKLVANIPTSGIGFQVDTPRGRVVDLGTVFSVHATKDFNTKVRVFRGKVVTSLVNWEGIVQSSKQINENQAIIIDFAHEGIVKIPYTSNDFTTSIQDEHGITQHSKTVVFLETPPASLVLENYQPFEHDDQIFIFPERKNLLLTEDLQLEISDPGVYRVGKDLPTEKSFISAGTTVDCYRVHYNPVINDPGGLHYVQGEVLFDRPVLGAIFTTEQLSETDLRINPQIQGKARKAPADRGLDIVDSTLDRNDELTISKDRKSLFFRLAVIEDRVDEFRVFLKSQ